MPLDPLKQVTFNEGEPLDIDKLNSIVSNTSTAWSASNAVFNTTVSSQKEPWVPVIEFGQLSIPSLAADTLYAIPLTLTSFSGLPTPVVTATYRSSLAKGQQVSVSVILVASTPTVHIVSNKAETSKVLIDWIAISKKTIA